MVRRTLTVLAFVLTIIAPSVASAMPEGRPPAIRITVGRVYDPYRHDYHAWNTAERREYRAYLAERHRRYIAYARQRAAERRAYWHWRHERLEHARR